MYLVQLLNADGTKGEILTPRFDSGSDAQRFLDSFFPPGTPWRFVDADAPIRKANIEKASRIYDAMSSIECDFAWGNTRQGSQYWKTVRDSLESIYRDLRDKRLD